MMRPILRFLRMFLFWAALAPAGISAQDLPEPMSPRRLVNDFAGLLSDSQRQALERKLVDFDRETSTQIAVVTVDDLGDYAPSDFAQRLHDKWGVGREGKNNGILVLVKPSVPGSRGEAYISVGYGLEGVIPDITAGRILDNEMIPRFREGDIYGGIDPDGRCADAAFSRRVHGRAIRRTDRRRSRCRGAVRPDTSDSFYDSCRPQRRSRGRIERQRGGGWIPPIIPRRRIAPEEEAASGREVSAGSEEAFPVAEEPSFVVAAFPLFLGKIFVYLRMKPPFREDRYAGARMRVTALGCNETVMGKMYRCLLLLTLAFFTFACEKGDDAPAPTPTPDVDRTVLVYLASDNNLYRFALQNLNDMKSAMEGLDGNLLVYIDEANGTSRLSKIESDETERVIETYGKENSASAAVLRRVVDRVLTLYPAESYGLILWSHGMGWIPAGIEETGTSSGLCCPRDTEAYPVTKHFGADTENGSSVHMEIPDLVAALPDGLTFDFILFDACFMGGVEVLYEMRHAAHYLIASPAEILGSGFPYDRIIPLIFSERL